MHVELWSSGMNLLLIRGKIHLKYLEIKKKIEDIKIKKYLRIKDIK